MSIKYIKHTRPVVQDDIDKYKLTPTILDENGVIVSLATHDIHSEVLLAYENGKMSDKNGTPVDMNAEFITDLKNKTNKYLKNKFASPFAKHISSWAKSQLEDVEHIPMIMNHKTDQVENTVGQLKGILYTKIVDGILALYSDSVIKDLQAKKDINNELLRATSFGTRPDGSIKELSFVINEAIPLAGLVMSEKTDNTVTVSTKTDQELQLAEQISSLQMQEHELDNVIIPNHLKLARLIRTGRLLPWKYEELITNPNAGIALELMESTTPALNLGVMYGSRAQLESIDPSDVLIEQMASKYKTATETKTIPQKEELIKKSVSFEEKRTKELKHILELAEYSPEVLSKYIKIELGETVDTEDCVIKDTLLTEYIQKSKDIKQQLKQLGE